MSKTAIVPICEYIKDNGIRCGSPATRGRTLCYHHDLVYRGHRIPKNAGCNVVPVLKNHRDVSVATTNILRAGRDGVLTQRQVKLMLYGLQIICSILPPAPRSRRRRRSNRLLTI